MPVARGTVSSPDMEDVAACLHAFEEMNQVSVTVSLSVDSSTSRPFVVAVAAARTLPTVDAEPVDLASVRKKVDGSEWKTMEALLLNLLYMLDGKLAALEMQG